MVPTADLREITMQVIFTAAEQQSTREFNRKLGRLLRDLPGAGDIASQLIESSYEPIDYQKLTRHLDSSQFTMQEDEAGNLVVWINPEATAAAMDLMLEQYSIVIEIGIALYPIARLAKRLIGGFAEKCVEFGQRFQRKPNPALGKAVPVKFGGFEGVPVAWKEGIVMAAHGDTVVVRLNASQNFVVAKQDSQLFYADSQEVDSMSKLVESGAISDMSDWEHAE